MAMSNHYIADSAKIINVGIIGSDCMTGDNPSEKNTDIILFNEIFNDSMLSSSKISLHKKISLSVISNLDSENKIMSISASDYNFMFYVFSFNDVLSKNYAHHQKNIKKLSEGFKINGGFLFVILTDCNDMEIDEDDDLVFSVKENKKAYNGFLDSVDDEETNDFFDVYRISLDMTKIFLKMITDSSVVNLSDEQIDALALKYVKRAIKIPPNDKRREVKEYFKKREPSSKLPDCGYSFLLKAVARKLKSLNQKKIVMRNYIYALEKIKLQVPILPIISDTQSGNSNDSNNSVQILIMILNEVGEISFLNEEMMGSFMKMIEKKLVEKFNQFFGANRNNVAIDTNLLSSIDAYTYSDFLSKISEIKIISERLNGVQKIFEKEKDMVNKMIVDHYNKEVGKMIDLDKITSAFKIFAQRDSNNVLALFEKMRENPQVISENMHCMNKWITFIDMCTELNISSKMISNLIEHIIYEKIKQSVDMTRTNRNDMWNIYPHCLLTFLLKNLANGFVFEKIYMMLSCNIRYSGRNITDTIMNLTEEKYTEVLILEHKLLNLNK